MRILYKILCLVAVSVALLSCAEKEPLGAEYGYAQFRVLSTAALQSKAELQSLQSLSQARKIRVVLMRGGSTITQTIPLNFRDEQTADYGVQSDKLGLLAGEYSVTGFYLYDALDELLITGDAPEQNTFTVPAGGLAVMELGVKVNGFGRLSFKLVKDFQTKADNYPFASIKVVDIVLRNAATHQEYAFEKLPVKIKNDYSEENGKYFQTAFGQCDTVARIPAGDYKVHSYKTYSDISGRSLIEARTVASDETFHLDPLGGKTEVKVPIRLDKSAEYIKDYLALYDIWKALGGPNWRYHGIEETEGCNWNFDKDIDLWGKQPGVGIGLDGRVNSINLSGFGIRGNLPDAIGQLTELQLLYLGTHNESIGGPSDVASALSGDPDALREHRLDFYRRTLQRDLRENMSEPLVKAVNSDPSQRPIVPNALRVEPKDIYFGITTNGLTGISKAVMRLKNLQQLYIANAPITSENFFKEIGVDSPYHGEKLKWADLEVLTDIEIYNCPNLTSLPLEMLTHLPDIQVLNVSNNQNIPAERLKADWEAIIEGTSGPRIQIIYMGHNNLREWPSYELLSKMVKLGLMECTSSGLEAVHPFGAGINLTQVLLDNNKLKEIPAAPDGYFCGMEQLESFSASHNEITSVPDIFNAKSINIFDSVNLSHNKISSFENGSAHRGFNATTIDLSYNAFTEFPTQLFSAGSPCQYFIFAGNGLREMKEGSLSGPKVKYLMSIDMSYNKLKALPAKDFYASNLPYLYGVDLSYNCLDYFPTEVLDAASMTVLALRHQRDDKGNRTLREWPTGIYRNCPSLQALYLGSNDIRKVGDTVTPQIPILEVLDNPNISISLASSACTYWQMGYFLFVYDKSQDIRGCPAMLQ